MERSNINLIRALLLMGAVTAAGVGLATLLSVIFRMTDPDFQLCLISVLFSGVSAIAVYVGFYISHDHKAAHSDGSAIYAQRKASFLLLAILLAAGVAFSVFSPVLGLLGSRAYAAIIEVIFTAAIGGSAYVSMTHFLPDGVICR